MGNTHCYPAAGVAGQTAVADGLRVYVAGPISAPDPLTIFENIRRGIEAARWLLSAGYAPFCPHLDYQFVLTRPADEAMITVAALQRNSIIWLRASDTVVLLDGWRESAGCRAEVAEASLQGIPTLTMAEFKIAHMENRGEI